MKVTVNSIGNQDNAGSTAFIFDLRNSTNITRTISWDKRLIVHINFMMNLNKFVYKTLYDNCKPAKFALNDTGDGYICLFWDKNHALTALKMTLYIKEFLDKKLPNHNKYLRQKYLKQKKTFPKLDYGFAIHTGGSTVERTTFKKNKLTFSKDFIYGIVANSVSRLESLNKIYVDYNVLVTGNFKDVFESQIKPKKNKLFLIDDSKPFWISLGRIDIKDGKEDPRKGHDIYALTNEFINAYRDIYM